MGPARRQPRSWLPDWSELFTAFPSRMGRRGTPRVHALLQKFVVKQPVLVRRGVYVDASPIRSNELAANGNGFARCGLV